MDQDALARYGVPAKTVMDLVESLGSKELGQVVEGQLRFPVVARLPENFRASTETVAAIRVSAPAGQRISLSNLVKVEVVEGPSTITREWGQRVLPLAALTREAFPTIRADVDQGDPYVFIPAARYQHFLAVIKAGKSRVGRAFLNNGLKDFHRLCRAAGVPVCEFHSLRKSFCTNLLEGAGGSKPMEPHAVQKPMGHLSAETTIRCYSKARKDAITVAREIVDRVALPQHPTGKVKIA